jgi:hypothetical protein
MAGMFRRLLALALCVAAVGSGGRGAAGEAGAAAGASGVDAPAGSRARAEAWVRTGREIGWWTFNNYRFQRGDDSRWAAPDFDDAAWPLIRPFSLPSRDGVYWVRWRVTQREVAAPHLRDGLLFKVVASYDLYWDGKLVGRNGRVGDSAAGEIPGMVDALFQIPREWLGPGEHVVALRMSSFHTGFPAATYGLTFTWGNFRTMLEERLRTAIFSVMAVGAALVVAIVFGLIWLLAGRRAGLLVFSLLFLCMALLQGLQAWRWLYEYPYSWHYPRLVTVTALATAMAGLLPLFVLRHFELGRWRWVFAGLGVMLVWAWQSSPIYNRIGLTALALGFVTAFGLSLVAVVRRRRGAAFAVAGLACSGLVLQVSPRDFLDYAFFMSVGPATLGLLGALVWQLRDERREARQAVLTAARLEIELLKRNLQPHFLLNTLATIQEVIEQEPKAAVTLIEALAEEFRVLSRVSGEKLIPLGQEIELCRAHLRVMSLRKGATCTLTTAGTDERALVPPALFHTLIENGLTHLLPRDGQQRFELDAAVEGGRARYVMRAHGERPTPVPGAGTRVGTGLRYIEARLEESFPGDWRCTSGPTAEGWETHLEMRRATLAQ